MLYVSLNQTDVALSELYIHEHLTLVADRLMYRWVKGRQTIKLSRRGNGERGTRVSRRAMAINGIKCVIRAATRPRDAALSIVVHRAALRPVATR